MTRIGLKNDRAGKMERRAVVWDESRMSQIAMQYRTPMVRTNRPDPAAETSAMSASNTDQADVSEFGDQNNVSGMTERNG